MDLLEWIGAPFLLGVLLGTLFATGRRRFYAFFGLGLLIGFLFVLAAYLDAPPDFEHSDGCSDCGMYLGRWWEPAFVIYVAAIGYVVYVLGLAVGAFVRALAKRKGKHRTA